MRRAVPWIFMLTTCAAYGQGTSALPPAKVDAVPLARAETNSLSSAQQTSQEVSPAAPDSPLPDSPGFLLQPEKPQTVIAISKAAFAASGTKPPPCRSSRWMHNRTTESLEDGNSDAPLLCVDILNPYLRFLDTRFSIPMSPSQKAYLAFRNVTDPFNLGTIAGTSAFTIAIDSHTAYGPGLKGFGKIAGVSLSQDMMGEFFGTFLIPSLAHEDPHYHRMPRASVPQRILHAVSRTIIAQHDDGSPMPNYATLLTYPIASEISNLYVPGIQSDGRSTTVRIFTGLALDPVNNIVTEFLPDLAKRVHIRIIFVQQILNQVVAGQGTNGGQASIP
ncbi:MAG: hypothetical protein JWM43_1776 [Acidobacteriaceae bacterium]|nr:hypothetical protein [Acidobacteriaceae bacterium]